MGLESSHQVFQMQELRSQRFQLKAMEAKQLAYSRHKRSKSEIYNRGKSDLLESPSTSCKVKEDMEKREYHIDLEKKLPDTNVEGPLKQEIMQLEKRLKDQLAVHLTLEKALGDRKEVIDSSNVSFMPKAYLVHGVPQTSMKRTSLLIKATCTVGGHSINANMIQSSFLACRTHWSGQWFRTFLLPVMKFKAREEWKRLYAIEKQEPLLHFALCSGSHSDPAVRIYTAKKWHQQLETAKEEYIRATVGIQKEQKVFLPKLIEAYAKDSCMSPQKVVDMIQHYLPETLCMAIKRCQRGRSHKIIEWVPHNSNFRYLLSKEVANPQIA